ncbi:hypothetical protein PM082_018391 [Marasmius tenuissimus]|nr:hypothetical protein PM082_018391 [Marasmius tenuissimus]
MLAVFGVTDSRVDDLDGELIREKRDRPAFHISLVIALVELVPIELIPVVITGWQAGRQAWREARYSTSPALASPSSAGIFMSEVAGSLRD